MVAGKVPVPVIPLCGAVAVFWGAAPLEPLLVDVDEAILPVGMRFALLAVGADAAALLGAAEAVSDARVSSVMETSVWAMEAAVSA